MTKINEKMTAEFARQRVNKAILNLVEAIAALEVTLSEDFYTQAFNEGIEWFKSELRKIDSQDEKPEVQPVITESEKIADQSIYSFIVDNPGGRTTDIIAAGLKLPIKPAPTERGIKGTINRLQREGKIDNKAGRWYSTKAKASNQKFQVMAYLPDGSKYLGTDVIKENI